MLFTSSQVSHVVSQYLKNIEETFEQCAVSEITFLINQIIEAEKKQRRVFLIGNGGSAATASHWATDLGKGLHYKCGRNIQALSLCDNTSLITALGNDLGYEQIFVDQLRMLASKDDVLIAFSASGNSPNIVQALQWANSHGMNTTLLVGFDGGRAKTIAHHCVHLPTEIGSYGVAEDVQAMLGHIVFTMLSM